MMMQSFWNFATYQQMKRPNNSWQKSRRLFLFAIQIVEMLLYMYVCLQCSNRGKVTELENGSNAL